MKRTLNFLLLFCMSLPVVAQQVEFTEYDLDNGLHVILHQDNTVPVATVGVMYHVGSKDESEGRTGFAHFLNISFLKEQKTLNVASGSTSLQQMEEAIMRTQLKIEHITTKHFLRMH